MTEGEKGIKFRRGDIVIVRKDTDHFRAGEVLRLDVRRDWYSFKVAGLPWTKPLALCSAELVSPMGEELNHRILKVASLLPDASLSELAAVLGCSVTAIHYHNAGIREDFNSLEANYAEACKEVDRLRAKLHKIYRVSSTEEAS
jgi:hypothetical protein